MIDRPHSFVLNLISDEIAKKILRSILITQSLKNKVCFLLYGQKYFYEIHFSNDGFVTTFLSNIDLYELT